MSEIKFEISPERDSYGAELVHYLASRIEQVAGPSRLKLNDDDLVIACTVRNGECYIAEFVEHYRKLGAAYFVFLDNGSTDGTLNICKSLPYTIVLKTDAPYCEYFVAMSQYLAERFGRNGWILIADIDEHFDYPNSDRIKVSQLLDYLNRQNFTCLTVQTLDMFSEAKLRKPLSPGEALKDRFRYFDISCIQKTRYHFSDQNEVSNAKITFNYGGIREKAFGLSALPLTKHPLLYYKDPKVSLVNPHAVKGAKIADISGVFYHYKFTPKFGEYVEECVGRGNHWNGSFEYRKYERVLLRDPDLCLISETSRALKNVSQLIDLDLVQSSPAFDGFCELS